MPRWSVKSKQKRRVVLVLPGFNQGRGKRGAWFAWTEKTEDFFRKFSQGWHTVKYEIFSPESDFPLSEGELQHLTEEINSSEQAYSSLLYFQEVLSGMGGRLRKRGIRGIFLYLMMILTVKQFWIIILLWPQTFLTNFVNYFRWRRVRRTENVVSSFWQRGEREDLIEALTEAKEIYARLDNDSSRTEPLRKYQYLRDHFKKRRQEKESKEKVDSCELVEQAYRDIISQLTGDSLLLKIVPKTIRERIVGFFHVSEQFPYPDNIFAVRNLSRDLSLPIPIPQNEVIGRDSKVEGNNLEMFLLRSKTGEGIVIPCPSENALSIMFRAETFENVQRKNLPLEVVLYVGREEEKKALLDINSIGKGELGTRGVEKTGTRIQNALLDTFRQQESLISYYFRELPAVYSKRMWRHPLYLWGNLVHLGFPWLFISHGIPAFAVIACTWIFWDYLWNSQDRLKWQDYFNNLLEGIDKAYHNMNLRVMVHSGLGEVNAAIKTTSAASYRDVLEKVEEYHFPRKFRDMVLLNAITQETTQLKDFQKEANDFTTLPIPAFYHEENENQAKPSGGLLG